MVSPVSPPPFLCALVPCSQIQNRMSKLIFLDCYPSVELSHVKLDILDLEMLLNVKKILHQLSKKIIFQRSTLFISQY